MKIRDYLALPFIFFSALFKVIAVYVGGDWTAQEIIEAAKRNCEMVHDL